MDIYETKRKSIAVAVEAINGESYERVTKTCFAGLDLILGRGFKEGQLILIGGRPAMGKTSFAISMMKQIAVKQSRPLVFFSLDKAGHQIMERAIRLESGVDANIKEVDIGKDRRDVILAAERLDEAPIILDDQPYAGFSYIREKCNSIIKEGIKPGLIIVDYLQLMKEYSKDGTEEVLQKMRDMAIDLKCPVMVLSQLDRRTDVRDNHRPVLNDLSVADDIEKYADVVIFIYREAYYAHDTVDEEKAEIIIALNKGIDPLIGTVTVDFREGFFRNCYDM